MYRGIILSVTASCLFAAQYYLAARVPDMSGGEVFGWRTMIALPFVTVFLVSSGEWKAVSEIIEQIKKKPLLLPGLILSSMLMTVQQWLFIWAPLNGHGLNVSLGYFLLPLVMLTAGYLLYGERISRLKKLAALSATAGVCHELYQAGGFSWEALTVSLGMTAYFILRKRLRTENLGGFWFDMMFMIPAALWFILNTGAPGHFVIHSSGDYLMVAIIGIISAGAFMSYITASRHLSFSLFGLMGYIEPVLLVIVSLLLG
jgi:chloramphenicol-sensitive protein RarD